MGNNQLLIRPSANQQEVKLAAAEVPEQGELLMNDATGFAHVADDTASETVAGPNLTQGAGAAGSADGDYTTLVDSGGALLLMMFLLVAPTTAAQVDLSAGASGSLDTISIDGVEILGGAVAFDTNLATTAGNAIKQINQSQGDFYAYLSGTAEINIVERIVTKAALVVVSTSTTITSDDTDAAGGVVLSQASIGADLYANNGRQAKISGNVVIGTVARVDDENNELFEPKAGSGRVAITGSVGAISQITAGGVSLMGNTITYTTSAEVTAGLIRDDINLLSGTHGYFAEVSGDEVVIYQTTATLAMGVIALAVTGALDNVVTEDIVDGNPPRVWVDLAAYGKTG